MSYLHDLLFYQPITPLHIGCGQDVGVVDLPVIRERTTGYPFIPGSGIRGSLRQAFTERSPGAVARLFGPTAEESENGPRYAGCLAVHDARLLLFPVRSDRAPFLWITCPAALHRFSREARLLLHAGNWPVESPPLAAADEDTLIGPFGPGPVSLEEMIFQTSPPPTAFSSWLTTLGASLEIASLAQRTALVSDAVFHYLVNHATQVIQHNRLTSAKTVAQGQLFSVEAVPPEAVFYGFLGVTQPRHPQEPETAVAEPAETGGPETREEARSAMLAFFHREPAGTWLQLGGDEGTGLGVTRVVWTDGDRPATAEGDEHAP